MGQLWMKCLLSMTNRAIRYRSLKGYKIRNTVRGYCQGRQSETAQSFSKTLLSFLVLVKRYQSHLLILDPTDRAFHNIADSLWNLQYIAVSE